jgi:hypothetical protein
MNTAISSSHDDDQSSAPSRLDTEQQLAIYLQAEEFGGGELMLRARLIETAAAGG